MLSQRFYKQQVTLRCLVQHQLIFLKKVLIYLRKLRSRLTDVCNQYLGYAKLQAMIGQSVKM